MCPKIHLRGDSQHLDEVDFYNGRHHVNNSATKNTAAECSRRDRQRAKNYPDEERSNSASWCRRRAWPQPDQDMRADIMSIPGGSVSDGVTTVQNIDYEWPDV